MSTDIQAARFAALSGRIGVLVIISGLLASCGVNIPQIVAGQISTDQAGSTRPLTASEVATVSDWLARHRYGWKPNIVTSPAGTLYISLDTASQPLAVRLIPWSGSDGHARRVRKVLSIRVGTVPFSSNCLRILRNKPPWFNRSLTTTWRPFLGFSRGNEKGRSPRWLHVTPSGTLRSPARAYRPDSGMTPLPP